MSLRYDIGDLIEIMQPWRSGIIVDIEHDPSIPNAQIYLVLNGETPVWAWEHELRPLNKYNPDDSHVIFEDTD